VDGIWKGSVNYVPQAVNGLITLPQQIATPNQPVVGPIPLVPYKNDVSAQVASDVQNTITTGLAFVPAIKGISAGGTGAATVVEEVPTWNSGGGTYSVNGKPIIVQGGPGYTLQDVLAGSSARTTGVVDAAQGGKIVAPNSASIADAAAIRTRVLGNIADSQTARASSNFDIHIAQSDQIRWGYAADEWGMTSLPAGSRVYGGIPGQSAYYTNEQALLDAGLNRGSLFQSLQVNPHPVFGYRPQMGIYEVMGGITVPSGTVSANPALGPGGATQYFIRDYNNQLRLIDTINLGR